MHAASIIVLCWAMIGAACVVSAAGVAAVILAVLVALIGLPHGAADHRFARSRLAPLLGSGWLAAFLLGYSAIALVVVAGWVWWPAGTIAGFLLASAWHFGQEEPRLAVVERPLRPLFRFARGGIVIWAPLAFRGGEVEGLFSVIAPRGLGRDFPAAFAALVILSWGMLAVVAAAWALQGRQAFRRGRRRRLVLFLDNAMVASLVGVFALVTPVVGFLVYFCGWHSARGLRRLRRELSESWPRLALSLAPLTVAAIVLTVAGVCLVLPATRWNDTVVRATFVGLSAVAVPHLLLHGLAPLLEPGGRRRPARSTRPAALGSAA
jgi:Brp/Blh family beta-carotene 15,15'-monooxygenase